MSSRCSFVNVNIGIPACGVVRATNSAALVIPEAAARSDKSRRLRVRGSILFSHGRVTWRASLLSQREPLFRVANRLGANVAGRNRKREKRREAESKSQHEQPPPIAPRSACDCKLAAAASRLSPHDVRSGGPAFPQRSCIASRAKKPVGSPTSSWARRVLEKSAVNSHPRNLPLPDTRGPRQAARKPGAIPNVFERSKDSANRVLSMIKALLNHAVRDPANGLSDDSAWRLVRPFRGASKPRDIRYTDEEARKLVERATDEAVARMITGIFLTGTRYGELAGARIAQFDARAKTKAGVRLSARHQKHFFRSRPPKGGTKFLRVRASGPPCPIVRRLELTDLRERFVNELAKGRAFGDHPLTGPSVSRGRWPLLLLHSLAPDRLGAAKWLWCKCSEIGARKRSGA